jgi:hypothetical protein
MWENTNCLWNLALQNNITKVERFRVQRSGLKNSRPVLFVVSGLVTPWVMSDITDLDQCSKQVPTVVTF